ncbi:MAG: hypothetical protein Kow0068_04350 [Marinilabiliales bacterium]
MNKRFKKYAFISIIIVSLMFSINISVYSAGYCFPQENDENLKSKEKDNYTLKMASAWIKFTDEDYYGALRIYRELYKTNKDDATLNFRMGQCFVELLEMDTALFHLQNAFIKDSLVDDELYFYMGQAYQYLGALDKAIDSYYKFKLKLSPRQNERHIVNTYLRQCHTAKELMENPVNVKVTNLGPNINSKYTDACPSLSADGKTLIFTSRRSENTGGKIDPYVEEYYDDVYYSTWNNETKSWNPAKNIGAPINTEGHDANMSISPDGSTIFIYKSIPGVTRSGDIWISEKDATGNWSEPKPFAKDDKYINSSYFESSACITDDGKTLYFVSERERGGFGNGDIYVSHKEGKEWSKPENLGPVINSEGDEIGVFIHPDGKTLFFSSDGHNSMGGHDIFMSVYENGAWSTPVNLGYPINTTREEIHFVFSTDRSTAYLSSSRENGYGKMDIYAVDMRYYFKNNKNIDDNIAATITGPPLAILKGTVVDAETSQPVSANIIIKNLEDNKTKITSSNEKGEYFITLPADQKYEITVRNKNYKDLVVKFKLPKNEGETPTMIKHLFLNKK